MYVHVKKKCSVYSFFLFHKWQDRKRTFSSGKRKIFIFFVYQRVKKYNRKFVHVTCICVAFCVCLYSFMFILDMCIPFYYHDFSFKCVFLSLIFTLIPVNYFKLKLLSKYYVDDDDDVVDDLKSRNCANVKRIMIITPVSEFICFFFIFSAPLHWFVFCLILHILCRKR